MFLSIFEAVNRLEVITKQRCNEITLLHYIWNGYLDLYIQTALLHKDLKCKAPLIEPNLRRNLGKWST